MLLVYGPHGTWQLLLAGGSSSLIVPLLRHGRGARRSWGHVAMMQSYRDGGHRRRHRRILRHIVLIGPATKARALLASCLPPFGIFAALLASCWLVVDCWLLAGCWLHWPLGTTAH